MKNILFVCPITISLILAFWQGNSRAEVRWRELSKGVVNVRSILLDGDDGRTIYIGTDNTVLKTQDSGGNWRSVLLVQGRNKEVNFMSGGFVEKDSLYAATGNGLFFTPNRGETWRRIFRGRNYTENQCSALLILPEAIYLGTKAGLFLSQDKGRSWHRPTSDLGKSHILAITCDRKEPGSIYVACVDGVFKTKDLCRSWERIFVSYPAEVEDRDGEVSEDRDTEEQASQIQHLIYNNATNSLYLATKKGVYKSRDKGISWEPLPDYGLLSHNIRFLLGTDQFGIYAVSDSGIFRFRDDRWQEVSLGLAAEDISFLASDRKGNLYAASEKGLFMADTTIYDNNGGDNLVSFYSKDEPQIQEVQAAAIKYAEVGPEKIARWRKQAKMKSVLPKLTVGLDKSESTNYEIYTSATTRYIYEGPHDKANGWDVALSWELGDLIWSDAQTSIDVRSRLMVELRNDILDEVNKLYFERLRIKMELDNISIIDRKKMAEKELKLEELTASLDALTGGYFSKQLQKKVLLQARLEEK